MEQVFWECIIMLVAYRRGRDRLSNRWTHVIETATDSFVVVGVHRAIAYVYSNTMQYCCPLAYNVWPLVKIESSPLSYTFPVNTAYQLG